MQRLACGEVGARSVVGLPYTAMIPCFSSIHQADGYVDGSARRRQMVYRTSYRQCTSTPQGRAQVRVPVDTTLLSLSLRVTFASASSHMTLSHEYL